MCYSEDDTNHCLEAGSGRCSGESVCLWLLACDQHGEGTLIRNQQWRAGKRGTQMPAAFRKCALASSSRVTVVGLGRMGSLRSQALYVGTGVPEPSSCSYLITILPEADMGQSRAGLVKLEGWVLISKKQRFWRDQLGLVY